MVFVVKIVLQTAFKVASDAYNAVEDSPMHTAVNH